ncbi:hypothetical protein E2C01_084677 [Portunus trituberculatus]|uniref:Uncharacterized protein n=1 Tax=Portunus trituberculatus TaxID=210409 RepID=A0A5B7J9X3_PORTR|nr:hypothetical protein [Portunus trituberculatus]
MVGSGGGVTDEIRKQGSRVGGRLWLVFGCGWVWVMQVRVWEVEHGSPPFLLLPLSTSFPC